VPGMLSSRMTIDGLRFDAVAAREPATAPGTSSAVSSEPLWRTTTVTLTVPLAAA